MPASGDRQGPVAGIILAAGASRRMGVPKQLLDVGGSPLLQRVVDAAASSGLDELIVVLGHRAEEVGAALQLPPRARSVVNPAHGAGMSTSLACGLRAAAAPTAAAVLLGDQPAVGATTIDLVLDAYRTHEAPIVRPVYAGDDGRRVPGHPVIIARELWVHAFALRGDEGLRGIIAEHPQWLYEAPTPGDPPRDIDTREDYENLLAERDRRGV